MRAIALVALVAAPSLALAGCGVTGPDAPTMTGDWSGASGTVSVELTLTEDDGRVSGTGVGRAPAGSAPIEVTGTHDHPDVQLTGRVAGNYSIRFDGRFDGDDTVEGLVNGLGVTDRPLTLERSDR